LLPTATEYKCVTSNEIPDSRKTVVYDTPSLSDAYLYMRLVFGILRRHNREVPLELLATKGSCVKNPGTFTVCYVNSFCTVDEAYFIEQR